MRAAILLTVLLASCSPSAEIAKRSSRIADRARKDVAAWDRVEDSHADMAPEAAAGRARAEATIADTHRIARALTGVEDVTPWWASTIAWVAGAFAVAVLGFVLAQSGALTGLRILIGWIPRRKVNAAELAVDMLDPSRPEGDREMIAAMRASDREFDAAFRKAQERRKSKT